jgi:hypothetical protein
MSTEQWNNYPPNIIRDDEGAITGIRVRPPANRYIMEYPANATNAVRDQIKEHNEQTRELAKAEELLTKKVLSSISQSIKSSLPEMGYSIESMTLFQIMNALRVMFNKMDVNQLNNLLQQLNIPISQDSTFMVYASKHAEIHSRIFIRTNNVNTLSEFMKVNYVISGIMNRPDIQVAVTRFCQDNRDSLQWNFNVFINTVNSLITSVVNIIPNMHAATTTTTSNYASNIDELRAEIASLKKVVVAAWLSGT